MFTTKLKIGQSTIYYAGLLGRWDKGIVDQESDVPSTKISGALLQFSNFPTVLRKKSFMLRE